MGTVTTTRNELQRKAYRPPEVARATGLSRAFIYQLIAEGRLRSIRVGRAILIPATAVDALLAGEPDEG